MYINIQKISFMKTLYRLYSTIKKIQDIPIERIRNIGILAHIDAGKTTTTERMLYFSGLIQHMGEVHHGNTVTDYMTQERERGITITSAAITFYWKKHQFNLIDTPGHIDFTMEVEQTLNVLDGAVVVLDGSAGVEAQTLTVWRQADKYNIPRIIYVNKMDRGDADISMCCESIEKKLDTPSLLIQLPVVEDGKFKAVIDILNMELMFYSTKEKAVNKAPITKSSHPRYWNDAKLARSALIDKLTEYDDKLAENVIKANSLDNINTSDIVEALRNVTYKQAAVPVMLGSSYKNVGVQSVMDAAILYLPSPNERNKHYKAFGDHLCARAFKVTHDKHKGPLVFFRIYNGTLNKGQKIYSIQQECSEQAGKLYIAFADDFEEVESVKNGNIAVLTGLKKIMSGDIVTNSATASQRAKKSMLEHNKQKGRTQDEKDIDKLLGIGVTPPEPVFFCSIEPSSLSQQTALENALYELQREDPSLRVTHDPETGQTVLAGMGELHLEIIRDRILKEYKVDADLGPLQIAYRESPISRATDSFVLETKIGTSKQFVNIRLSLIPLENESSKKDILAFDKTPDAASNIAAIFPKHMLAVKQGIEVGLAHGPKVGCQVVNAQIMLHHLEVGRGTSDTMIAAAATQLVQKLLKDSGANILEPVMHLEIVVPEEVLTPVLADISRRRAAISTVALRGTGKISPNICPEDC
ncbi:unnamed protein product [Acanthoscelides obtectus]|uniref:Tr-type G domain-containing protein n=1 Tax=Acanthoscelides obtectus TaxID=200917 RepID=A0A9P0MF14_ACAOB|nr:unnamed protein product [Acanthoscelides obtectus]CAK1679779.1 Ribosome-releasing factor 2, mitochondrial [Acanthoscelides obtectus]